MLVSVLTQQPVLRVATASVVDELGAQPSHRRLLS